MNVQQSDLIDPALVAEVDLARAAAQEEAGDERVGAYVEYQIEDSAAVTHLFEADKPGYHGWRWAVTITSAGPATDVTVSEVVLLPGPTALVAPEWIPWQQRVQAGDLGVGDLLPTSPDDARLVPAYVASDDPAVEEMAAEAGLGRVRVMSRSARLDAVDRWLAGDFGPRSDMARSAPAQCGTCGFYLPLAGSLRVAFGTCGNEFSPADGHVVHVEYGCGAHSEAEVEQVSPVLVADLIYDDAQLDVEPLTVVDEVPSEDAVLSDAVGSAVESVEPAADEDAASVSGMTASVAPEVVVSDEEAEPGESRTAVESAGAAVGEVSGEPESPGADGAGSESEPAAGEASVSAVTTPDESTASEAAVPGEEAPEVESDEASGESAEESEADSGEVADEVPVAPVVEATAPATIEPVVTGETSPSDESASRE